MSCVPIGMFSGIVLQLGKGIGSVVARVILEGIAAGTFIYVATVEMFASEFRHSHSDQNEAHSCNGFLKLFMVLLGCCCFIFLNFLSRASWLRVYFEVSVTVCRHNFGAFPSLYCFERNVYEAMHISILVTVEIKFIVVVINVTRNIF